MGATMRTAGAILFLAIAFGAFGADTCTTDLSYSAQAGTPVTSTQLWTVRFVNCPNVTDTTFTPETDGTLILGGTKYVATIKFFDKGTGLTQPKVSFTLKLPTGANDPLNAYYESNSAQFQYGTQTWTPTVVEPLNVKAHSIHIGRAEASNNNSGSGTSSTNDQPNAYELKVESTYSYRPPYTTGPSTQSIWSRTQRDFSLKVDTTDKKSGFVDDNSITAGQFFPRLSLGQVFVEGKIGGQVRYERPVHNNDHNLDATATAAALIPAVQAANLFSTSPKLASPLSLALSYGYRSKRMTGTDYRGRVFEGTAFYHFYLLDNYRVDFTATTTYNDLNNLPAGSSKTQHAFTASVAYESSPNAPFNVVATYQNGSFGAVATKLRQFFLGVAVSKIDQILAARNTGGK
jgi:hypothetical protein